MGAVVYGGKIMPKSPSLKAAGKTRLEETRHNNRRLILQRVFDEGPISRAEIARHTELGRATVSEITAQLVAEGLVVEVGQGTSTGGKPPTLVELDPAGRFVVAVDLSRRPIAAALLNLRGRIVARAAGKTVAPQGHDAIEEMHRVISELIAGATAPALGIGVGVPGAVDDSGGMVTAEELGWWDVAVRDEFEDVYGFPTYIVSAAQAAALAEFTKTGSDPGAAMMYVKVDDRISTAVILTGRIMRSSHHGGDLTHVVVSGLRRKCVCGRTGCLGTVATLGAILGPDFSDMTSDARLRLAADISPELEQPGAVLGRALGPVAAALDVDRIVIGGDLAVWSEIAPLVQSSIEHGIGWSPQVSATKLGDSAVMLGAAGVVLSRELGVVWG
jgi:predicted NBD/HSP70 family sugar kinase